MDYVSKNLKNDERIIVRAKYNWLKVIPSFFITIVLFSILFGFINLISGNSIEKGAASTGFIVLILSVLFSISKVLSMQLVITNKRLMGKTGLFKIKTTDIPLDKIDNVEYFGTFLGRMFGYYTISISSLNVKWTFKGVRNASEFKNSLIDAIDMSKDEARKAQAEEIAKALNK